MTGVCPKVLPGHEVVGIGLSGEAKEGKPCSAVVTSVLGLIENLGQLAGHIDQVLTTVQERVKQLDHRIQFAETSILASKDRLLSGAADLSPAPAPTSALTPCSCLPARPNTLMREIAGLHNTPPAT